MDEMIVIGVSGPARSGKDTVAQALGLHLGFHRIALADGIREAFGSLAGPTGEFFKELTPEHNYRRALQLFGTESREAILAPKLWLDLALAKIHYAAFLHPAPRRRFVIPDIRYGAEAINLAVGVAGMGGRFACLKLHRPGVGPIAEAAHSSEQGIRGVRHDFLLVNNQSIDYLIAKAVAFAEATIARAPHP